jgi:hypothetical protein
MRWQLHFWTSLKKFKTEAQFCATLGFSRKFKTEDRYLWEAFFAHAYKHVQKKNIFAKILHTTSHQQMRIRHIIFVN